MKMKNLLDRLGIFVTIVLIAGVISYATGLRSVEKGSSTPPVEQSATPERLTPAAVQTPPIVKKKPCGCCAERIARLTEQIRKAREHR